MKITHCATAPMQFTCLVLSGATFKGLVSFLSQFSTTTHHYFLLWDHWIRTQIYKFKKTTQTYANYNRFFSTCHY